MSGCQTRHAQILSVARRFVCGCESSSRGPEVHVITREEMVGRSCQAIAPDAVWLNRQAHVFKAEHL